MFEVWEHTTKLEDGANDEESDAVELKYTHVIIGNASHNRYLLNPDLDGGHLPHAAHAQVNECMQSGRSWLVTRRVRKLQAYANRP